MPEAPRRKRFQIHLSTAIVLMFVAGGLMWANTRPRIGTTDEYSAFLRVYHGEVKCERYGFPFTIACFVPEQRVQSGGEVATVSEEYQTSLWFLVLNAVVAMEILFIARLLCEGMIRRRKVSETRK
ncbi:MAG TPA: hypothetical protein VKX17_04580 [Planctomycetota bacterium]|nr:hypothetical protein [Planctomycetota bacterium]